MKKTEMKKMTAELKKQIEAELKKDKNLEISWDIADKYILPEKFIEKHIDQIDWDCVSSYQPLSTDFLFKHADKINWKYYFGERRNDANYAQMYNDLVGAADINEFIFQDIHHKISWDFIREHKDEISKDMWHMELSKRADLTDELAEEFADKVHWYWVTYYCKRSEKFIAKHADKDLAWFEIANSKNYSKKFKETVNEECRRQIGMKNVCWD